MATALEFDAAPRLEAVTHRCSTFNGVPVDPTEAMVVGLWARVRRVVVDARGVTIDLGTARYFTGSARHAVLVTNPRCIWPGCDTPADSCEVDHLHEHQHGGRTHAGNGAPLCGRHNRHKHNHRFQIQREPTGGYTVLRPDGTPLA